MEARHSALRAEEAEDVVKELRAELVKAGITPPSPGLGPVSFVREAPCPLIKGSRCAGDAARRHAAVPR
ncbi:hypothetical protein C1J00_02545 [Streptomyces cahuitamycinicus]|uniref:Uncharacterized protein n=1 Tax=Streptomyces cahuitamycinicus TaxID=2070367 RepID=A0A2N8TXF2_9ACTN|nr:hypothetical protein C1J00_02545 [Streptomyces cahuitamycinicus]